MESGTYEKITAMLEADKPVPVRLWDGLKLYLIEDFPLQERYKAKFLPCAKNAKEYVVKYDDIKEVL